MSTITSTCIQSVGYESGTLYITFRNGRSYTLRGVPEYHYIGLLNSSSPGRYFNFHLKGRYY